jgi:myo-inositol catabolism protein IolC
MNYNLTYTENHLYQKKCKNIFCFFTNHGDKCAYNAEMEKSTAIKLAGNQTKLAAILGISQAAIAQWGEDVPMMRLFQLKTVKPEWFKLEKQAESKFWRRSPKEK